MSAPKLPPIRTRSVCNSLSERKHLAFTQRSEYLDWFRSLDLASMKRLHKAWNKVAGGKS